MKEKIIKIATDLFLRYGIKSVSMDDIAKKVGISKKTLYQSVEDKSSLIKDVLSYFLTNEMTSIVQMFNDSSCDAMTKMLTIHQRDRNVIGKMKATVLYDLKKYYRECWDFLNENYFEELRTFIVRNLKEGIEQGVFRETINPELVSKIHINNINVLNQEEMFPVNQYSKTELLDELIYYHLFGVASQKGHQIIIKFLENNKVLNEKNN